jgi:NADH-quinone oxidoreductase subunit C
MLGEKIIARFGSDSLSAQETLGAETITVRRERALEIFNALRNESDFAFDMLTDLTAVDWPDRTPRFQVVYHLSSLRLRHRLRVKIEVGEVDAWVYSVVGVWKAADWLERECYDLFGIEFRGHPDLRRILLYDSFQGHPLRKDYPVTRRQPIVEEIDPVVSPLRSSR